MSTLIINRKPGEAVIIDGPARLIIGNIETDRVRLVFEADRKVKIDREEIRRHES